MIVFKHDATPEVEIMMLKHFICLCLVGIAMAASHPAATAAVTRVALVSTDDKEGIHNVLDLAEAELGSQTKIELLERRQIERVLSEQKLSLSGLVEANQIVAAGQAPPGRSVRGRGDCGRRQGSPGIDRVSGSNRSSSVGRTPPGRGREVR